MRVPVINTNLRYIVYQLVYVVVSSYIVFSLFKLSPLLTIIIPVTIILIWRVTLRPEIGITLVMLCIPFQRGIFGDYGLVLLWIALFITSIPLFIHIVSSVAKKKFRDLLPFWLVFLFFVYIIFTMWVSAASHTGKILVIFGGASGSGRFRYVLQTPIFFCVLALLVDSRKRLEMVLLCLKILLGLILFVSFFEISAQLLGGESPLTYLGTYFPEASYITKTSLGVPIRFVTIFAGWTGAAQYSLFLIVLVLILFPLLLYKARTVCQKVTLWIAILLSFITIYFVQSIGSWVCLCIGLVTLAFLFSKRKVLFISTTAIVLFFLILSIVVGIFPLGILPDFAEERVTDLFNIILFSKDVSSRSAIFRLDWVRMGWEVFLQNPIFGAGYANFANPADQAGWDLGIRSLEKGIWVTNFSHNSYISILAELGIVGMLWFILFIIYIFKTSISNIKSPHSKWIRYVQNGAIAAVVSVLVFMFHYGNWLYTLSIWLPIGLTFAIRNVINNDPSK